MNGRTGYPIPAWRVTLDGKDLTDRIAPRLIELTLKECRSGEADQLDLRIHDHDGRMALPRKGVTLTVALGWREAGLIDKGTFVVDEVEHSGPPDVITIRARSAELTKTMRTRRDRSWHDTTVGAVIGAIAGEHSLRARVAPALANLALDHLDQSNESDVALLTRLGSRFDAVATVKAGNLVFSPIDSGTTPAGIELPRASITRADGDSHRFSEAERDTYSGVRAYWNDKKGARRKAVLVGTSTNAKNLRETYDSAKTAREHADAEWKRVQRGAAKMDYSLALGRADLYPEQRIDVSGFKAEIDGRTWLIAETTHSITGSSGFTTALVLETSSANAKPADPAADDTPDAEDDGST
ncbi:TPA: phage late control D family protein [Stenotrophomonas maltophilia]|nr:phage late control D family protein [Stenotrophomonas maltophilia]HEL7730981.1 phage late control D family protein [Stenotrophomonas maltophilia]